jgi:hypothetical protein
MPSLDSQVKMDPFLQLDCAFNKILILSLEFVVNKYTIAYLLEISRAGE